MGTKDFKQDNGPNRFRESSKLATKGRVNNIEHPPIRYGKEN